MRAISTGESDLDQWTGRKKRKERDEKDVSRARSWLQNQNKKNNNNKWSDVWTD